MKETNNLSNIIYDDYFPNSLSIYSIFTGLAQTRFITPINLEKGIIGICLDRGRGVLITCRKGNFNAK